VSAEHPSPADLLELHFQEAEGARRDRLAAHAEGCPGCRETLAELAWIERSLAALPEEEPPADGLERVLERVAGERPAVPGVNGWLAPVVATLAGVGIAAATIYAVGAWLVSTALPPVTPTPLLDPARAVSGFGLATLGFFGIGSFITLALAPVLLMEAQSRGRSLARS
jgi:anti-sigma factor RsiW